MKRVNVHPNHCEFAGTHSGFTLTFYARTETGTDMRYVLHFDFWWVGYLARDLWKAINYRRAELLRAEAEMQKAQP